MLNTEIESTNEELNHAEILLYKFGELSEAKRTLEAHEAEVEIIKSEIRDLVPPEDYIKFKEIYGFDSAKKESVSEVLQKTHKMLQSECTRTTKLANDVSNAANIAKYEQTLRLYNMFVALNTKNESI